MTRAHRLVRWFALGAALALAATGCGFKGIYSLPLPGAVGNGSNTYTVKVQFADVLDLVPYSAVKVNGATVGHISSISLQHGHALVTCKVLDSAKLPANAIAAVQQTSILGEKYVELEPPSGLPAQGRLTNGATIPLSRTSTDASVEEVLGALSALLSGGGVQQIHTIAHEVNTALRGRTAVSRDLLDQFRTFTAGLNVQKQQILRAISGVDTLARTVKGQEGQLVGALDALPPALGVLANDRQRLTQMLVSLQHFGDVAVHVVNASRANLLTNLRNLRPTLAQLAKAGQYITQTLGIIITYPTADGVEQEYAGDYGNLSLTIDLSHQSLATFLKASQLGSAASPKSTHHAGGGKASGAKHPAKSLVGTLHNKAQQLKQAKKLKQTITRFAIGKTIGSLLLGSGS